MLRNRGTTLIEIILYLALALGILFAVGVATFAAIESKEKARAIDEVNQAVDDALAVVLRSVSDAQDITTPFPGEATGTLRFMKGGDAFSTTTITIQGTRLLFIDGQGVVVDLLPPSVDLTHLQFLGFGTSTSVGVRISMEASRGTTAGVSAFHASASRTTTVTLRNRLGQ